MNETTLSIIIVDYKSDKYLEKCLESIAKKSDWEIIIVDNNIENIGYGAGLNKGAKIAEGKYLLFLNPDTVILDEAIEKMVNFMENNNEVGILGPKIYNSEEKDRQLSFCKFPDPLTALFVYSPLKKTILGKWFWRKFTYGLNYEGKGSLDFAPYQTVQGFARDDKNRKGFLDFAPYQTVQGFARDDKNRKGFLDPAGGGPRNDEIHEVDEVSGAGMMVRKDVFEKVGGFDEKIFLYFEENDLCRRVQKTGEKIVFYPEAEIIHYGGKSSPELPVSNNYFRQSRRYYFKKHYGTIGMLMNYMIWLLELGVKVKNNFIDSGSSPE